MPPPNKMHGTRGAAGMDATTAVQLGLDPTYSLEHDELFAFDVHGYLVLRGLLSASQLAAALVEGDSSSLLTTHPELLRYVHALASPPLLAGGGGGTSLAPTERGRGDDRAAYLDTPLRELPEIGPADTEPPLTGGDGARFRHSRAWVRRFGRYVQRQPVANTHTRCPYDRVTIPPWLAPPRPLAPLAPSLPRSLAVEMGASRAMRWGCGWCGRYPPRRRVRAGCTCCRPRTPAACPAPAPSARASTTSPPSPCSAPATAS
jgi:hypothetical protein